MSGQRQDGRQGDVMRRVGNSNAIKTGVFVKNPLIAMQCDKCPVKDVCEKFETGAKCYYELHGKPDLETANGLLDVLREKTEIDYVRYQRAIRAQTALGSSQLDRDVTTLSTSLTRDLQVLAEMSVKFGVIDPAREDLKEEHHHTHIHAENVNLLQITSEELQQAKKLEAELSKLQNQLALTSANGAPK
jgi:hypothetical protein